MSNDKMQLMALQTNKLNEDLDALCKGYPMTVVGCVLVAALKRVFDAAPAVFHNYMGQAQRNGWFDEPKEVSIDNNTTAAQVMVPTNMLSARTPFPWEVAERKKARGKCSMIGCDEPIEAQGYCKEHLADPKTTAR